MAERESMGETQRSAARRSSLGSTRIRTLSGEPGARFALAALGLTLLVSGFAFWTYWRIEHVVKRQIAMVMNVSVDAATEGARSWLEDAVRAANAAAQDASVASLLQRCFVERAQCDSRALDARLGPYLHAGGFARFTAVDSGGEQRASGPLDSG